MSQSQSQGSSPYATGGGGVELEHEYAASALASLLLAQPIEGLGDELTVTHVAMQQGAWSPVDDVIVRGIAPGGDRTLRVASRRHPTIGKSDPSTVKLFADFLQVVLRSPESLAIGRTRLGLAVSAPFGPASELSVLTDVARRQPDWQSFEQAINAERAYTADVRARLKNVADVVEAALADSGEQSQGRVDELTWQLLKGLFVIPLQFEGDVALGRTSLVARLQTVAGSPARAEDLRLRLVGIASQGAIRAGVITRPMLRAELRPFGLLNEAPDFSGARPQVALLESELRARTPPSVPVPGTGTSFTVDRSTLQARLVETIAAAPAGGVVIVHGEPDVGKSALVLAAVDSIRSSGGVALALSLRDLPSTPVSLKAALGLDPSDLFAAGPSAPVTAVVLDGAEVVQERDGGTVGALVGAAAAAGKTTVLVVRDDAVESLADLLRSRGVANPARLAVGSLSTSEIATLVAAVPDLARLATDPRANWLLSRLGLVELLLKGAQRGSNLPETLSSEAEVFATVWKSLIRQDERIVGGIAPDDRETAVVEVARQLLSSGPGPTLNGPALAMLRSDGVLVSYDRSAAWQTGDRFGSDVLRDFASARLFLRQGLSVLAGSTAPRWAVRATRLYAQARLARVVNSGESTFAAEWTELRAEFASLAANHGARWAELPWEALLTAGWAGQALNSLTPALLADSEMQGEAVRTATLRFSPSGACDAAIGAPLVSWLVDTAGVLNAPRSHRDEPAVELVVAWLRGLARLDAAGEDISEFRWLRARIRDALLAGEIDRSDSERLEALALLGADQTDASRAVLRHIAQVAPGFLATVVENFDVATTMARLDLALLMELADAYYIERPADTPWGSSLRDDGIRGHQSSGFNTPLAAWYLGPFAPLLRSAPRHGLRLINRMLDRGARARLASPLDLDNRARRNQSDRLEGVALDIIGMGPRTFVGDSHVWSWYRGSSVGPYPCMSALLAMEIAMDESARQGVTLKEVATAVLREATTIASLGLLFGFFVRHLEEITDELDSFLASPAIWELEFGRVASEGHIHVQRGDSEQLVNVDRRRWPPVDVAARLVILAQQRGDNLALDRLRAVGLRLVEAAGADSAPPHVQQWAAHLDAARYSIQSDGARRVLKLDLPESVTQAMESAHQRSANVAELFRLLHRYRSRHEPPYRPTLAVLPTDVELVDDYHVARRLETEFASDIESRDRLVRSLSGVAAAIIHKASKDTDPPLESVDWALQLLIQAAIHLGSHQRDYALSFSPDGADRQAALVIPLLFADFDDGVDSSTDISDVLAILADALSAGIGSPSIEVRHYAAEGLRGLNGHSCKALPDGRCWHELVWSAIEAGARTTTLGERTTEGTRQIEPITGDVSTTLANTPEDKLMLSHIAPTAIAAIDAARGDSCIRGRAAPLRDALLHSLARAACHWARNHYEWRSEYQAAFASALLQWSVADDSEAVVRLAVELTQSVEALGDYLHALAIVATHEPEVVPTLTELWPQLMAVGLKAVVEASKEERHRPREKLVRSLVPSPSTLVYVDDIDAILRTAATHWFPLTAVTAHIQTWLKYARGEMSSVDALVGFIKTQPIETQAAPGLDWIRALIVDRDGSALTCGFLLVSWLSELRDSKALHVTANPSYRATVDALVLGNFRGARDLQQRDE